MNSVDPVFGLRTLTATMILTCSSVEGHNRSLSLPSRNHLLKNEDGKFINATCQYCPELAKLGMITDALFTDFNNDGKSDLVVVGEFLPITFLATRRENLIW